MNKLRKKRRIQKFVMVIKFAGLTNKVLQLGFRGSMGANALKSASFDLFDFLISQKKCVKFILLVFVHVNYILF